jgi:hypothetical protein
MQKGGGISQQVSVNTFTLGVDRMSNGHVQQYDMASEIKHHNVEHQVYGRKVTAE